MNSKENSLCHEGRLGQQWYVKLGPPYPLDQEAKEIYRNRKNMTDEEFDNAVRRLKLSREVGIMAGEIKEGKSWLKKAGSKFSNTTAETLGTKAGLAFTDLFFA